jgi:protein TonB
MEPEPEAVEEQKIEPPPPAEKAEVVMPPKPKPKPKPKSPPKPKPQAPQAASASNTPRADIAGSGARASPSEINRYSARVRAAVERNKRVPSVAGGAKGRVHIAITISRSGGVTGLRIAGSSGNPALDAAARQAVATANIPPIPDGLPDTFNMGIPITYNIR